MFLGPSRVPPLAPYYRSHVTNFGEICGAEAQFISANHCFSISYAFHFFAYSTARCVSIAASHSENCFPHFLVTVWRLLGAPEVFVGIRGSVQTPADSINSGGSV